MHLCKSCIAVSEAYNKALCGGLSRSPADPLPAPKGAAQGPVASIRCRYFSESSR